MCDLCLLTYFLIILYLQRISTHLSIINLTKTNKLDKVYIKVIQFKYDSAWQRLGAIKVQNRMYECKI